MKNLRLLPILLLVMVVTACGSPASNDSGEDDSTANRGENRLYLDSYTLSQSESNTTLSLQVHLENNNDGAASVSYLTRDNTAVAGSDYQISSGVLSWSSINNWASQTIEIVINNDSVVEDQESFYIDFISPDNATMATTSVLFTLQSYDIYHVFRLAGIDGYYDLLAIDPADPTTTVMVHDATSPGDEVKFASTLRSYQYSPEASELSHSALSTALVSLGDGKLYKVDLQYSSVPLSSRLTQVSSESSAQTICESRYVPNLADPQQSYILYSLPGGNSNCDNGGDDLYKLLNLNNDTATAPVAADKIITPVHNWVSGSLHGFLSLDGSGNLSLVDANFTAIASNLLTLVSSAEVLADDHAGKIYLQITSSGSSHVAEFDITSNTLDIIHTLAVGTDSQRSRIVGPFLYLADGDVFGGPTDLVQLNLTTTPRSVSTLLTELDIIDSLQISNGYVVYSVNDGTVQTDIKSLPISWGGSTTPATLATADPLAGEYLQVQQFDSQLIYYNLVTENGSFNVTSAFAGQVNADGTARVELADSQWAGRQYNDRHYFFQHHQSHALSAVIRLDSCVTDATLDAYSFCGETSIQRVSAFDGSSIGLGTASTGFSAYFGPVYQQNQFYLEGGDLFYLDLAGQRLMQTAISTFDGSDTALIWELEPF